MTGMSRSFGSSIVISGVDELFGLFERLNADVQNRISRKVLQAGVDFLVSAGRSDTPTAKTPGHDNAAIRDSIRGRILQASNGVLTAKVGFNVGYNSAPHAHLYVLGTIERYTSGKSRSSRGRLGSGRPASRGIMPGNDFFNRSMSASEQEAFYVMQQVFFQEMESVS